MIGGFGGGFSGISVGPSFSGGVGGSAGSFDFGPDFLSNLEGSLTEIKADAEALKAEQVLTAQVLEQLGGRNLTTLSDTTRGAPGVLDPASFGSTEDVRKRQTKDRFRIDRTPVDQTGASITGKTGVNISGQSTGAQI